MKDTFIKKINNYKNELKYLFLLFFFIIFSLEGLYICNKLYRIERNTSGSEWLLDDIESATSESAGLLSDIESNISSIESDISSIKSNISSIESDVSNIESNTYNY